MYWYDIHSKLLFNEKCNLYNKTKCRTWPYSWNHKCLCRYVCIFMQIYMWVIYKITKAFFKKFEKLCTLTMYLLDLLLQGAQLTNGPLLLCSEIHHCVNTKATFSWGRSQPVTKSSRDTMADPFLGYARLLTGDHLKGPPFALLNLLRTKNLLPSLELRQGPDLHSNPMALCLPPPTHSSLSLTNVFLSSLLYISSQVGIRYLDYPD